MGTSCTMTSGMHRKRRANVADGSEPRSAAYCNELQNKKNQMETQSDVHIRKDVKDDQSKEDTTRQGQQFQERELMGTQNANVNERE